MGFAEQLRQRRIENGLSMTDLARIIRCDHATISRLESEERLPSRRIATRLSERLDPEGYPTLIISAGYLPDGYQDLNGSLNKISGIINFLVTER